MIEFLINYATIAAFLLFCADLIYQLKQVPKTKDSSSVSTLGLAARATATIILLVKFISLNDLYLIGGQSIFSLLVLVYLALSWKYRNA